MRRLHRTLRGPSVLPKTQRNRAMLFRTRFITIRRSEIHISLKLDADADVGLLPCTIHHISQGQGMQYTTSAHASTTLGM
jgi:hypothetical protein